MPSATRTTCAARRCEPDAPDQRDQGHDPALAVVVRAHDERHVLDRDDDRDRPEHERDDAVDAGLGRADRVVSTAKTVCSAYSGLVPMSPKTIPSAPSDSAAMPL